MSTTIWGSPARCSRACASSRSAGRRSRSSTTSSRTARRSSTSCCSPSRAAPGDAPGARGPARPGLPGRLVRLGLVDRCGCRAPGGSCWRSPGSGPCSLQRMEMCRPHVWLIGFTVLVAALLVERRWKALFVVCALFSLTHTGAWIAIPLAASGRSRLWWSNKELEAAAGCHGSRSPRPPGVARGPAPPPRGAGELPAVLRSRIS